MSNKISKTNDKEREQKKVIINKFICDKSGVQKNYSTTQIETATKPIKRKNYTSEQVVNSTETKKR